MAGAVQTGIILKDLSTTLIPIVDETEQNKIREIATKAFQNQIDSEKLYSQAENLLL